MAITQALNVRSVLGLIAADFSYKNNAQVGDLLQTIPDNAPEDEVGFPAALSLVLGDESLTQFEHFVEPNGINGVTLSQFEVVNLIQDSNDGFGAVFFKSKVRGIDGKFDYIVAFRGTDGRDRQDWFANLDLASRLWDAHSPQIISYLVNLQVTGDIPRLNRIHFTGQSLGGGLAQYAAYDFAQAVKSVNPGFSADMTLTTFNAFGGVRGLQQLAASDPRRESYDPELLRNVTTAHYSIDNDFVHRLGKGPGNAPGGSWHVNGAGNTYRFAFRRFENGVPVDGPRNLLGIVEGHRIESGFYRGFERYGTNFMSAQPEFIAYVDTDVGRSLGAVMSRVGNKGFTTETSAQVRLLVGAASIGVAGSTTEIIRTAAALHTALDNSGKAGAALASTYAIATLAIGTRLATKSTIFLTTFGAVYASYLEQLSDLSGEQKSLAYAALNSFMPADHQVAEETASPLNDSSPSEQATRVRLAIAALASQALDDPDAEALLVSAGEVALAEMLKETQASPSALAAAILSADPRQALRQAAEVALKEETNLSREQKTFFAASIAAQIQAVAEIQGAADTAYVARTRLATDAFLANLGQTLANGNAEFQTKYAGANDALLTGANFTDAEFREYRSGLLRALNDPSNASIRTELSKAIAFADAGGQVIALREGIGVNELDVPGVDPHTVITVSTEEGAGRMFVAQLPFTAGEGGQRIRIKLTGAGAESFDVVRGADTVTLDTNGEFDIFVAQGERQVAFALVQRRDVDVDGNLTLSATLLGTDGSPSHSTRLEANVALNAHEEPGDPVATNVIVTDTGQTFYYDTAASDSIAINDLPGNPGNDNLSYDPVAYEANQFAGNPSGGDDWVNTFSGRDVIYTGAGNDLIEAGAGGVEPVVGGDLVHAGAGNDRVYGNQVVDTEQAIAEGEAGEGGTERGDALSGGAGDDLAIGTADGDVLTGGAGADLLIGGLGNDYLLGDTDYEARVYDWGVTPTATGDSRSYSFVGFSDLGGAGAGQDALHGGAGDDVAFAEGGDDFIDLGVGNDHGNGGEGDDVVFGKAGNDLLSGGDGGDFLDGGEDADRLFGDGGADALYGGTGDDFLQGDALGVAGGADYLNGEAGNDVLSGTGGADVLVGGEGNDQLFGDATDTPVAEQLADELYGGAGDDLLQGFGGDDTLDGGAGTDQLFGMAGADTLTGGEGDDQLFGEDGTGIGAGAADTIVGGAGNDGIRGEGGDDWIDGGEGDDTIGGDDGADRIFGGAGVDQIAGGAGVDVIRGEAGDDTLLGDAGEDDIDGGLGADNIAGGADADQIAGGDGTDTIQGEAGNDRLAGGGDADFLFGGDGSDFLDGGPGSDHLQGGADVDIYAWDFGSGEDRVADDLANLVRFGPGITRDFLSLGIGSLIIRVGGENALRFENFDAQNPYAEIGVTEIQFTDFEGNIVDTMAWSELIDLGFDLVGTPESDFISGTAGDDRIVGLEESDSLLGNGGNDIVFAGAGDDFASGGIGDDELFGDEGNDQLLGDAGADTLLGGLGDDRLEGGDAADQLFGEAGEDQLIGGEADDMLDGGDGADNLSGEAGADTLTGGAGDDRLDGGLGPDAMTGGVGDDVYVVDEALDQVNEAADAGFDTIEAGYSYVLDPASNVEALKLIGGDDLSGTGNDLDNVIFGNEGNNVLAGHAGDDELWGEEGDDVLDGGAGEDLMLGSFGNDVYAVDSEEDAVVEERDFYERQIFVDPFTGETTYARLEQGGGVDTVVSTVSFELDQWTENLALVGSEAIDGVGNVESNLIQGNGAGNDLYGYRLDGESDTYPSIGVIVQQFTAAEDAAEELLHDAANAAIYRGEFPWFVPQQVELGAREAGDTLIGGGGNDRLYGHLDDDRLEGGAGNDLLYGFAGADTMAGGAGDDTYVVSGMYFFRVNYAGGEFVEYVDDSEDELVELEGEGIDTVVSEVSFELPGHIENLTLVFDTRDFDPDGTISIRSAHELANEAIGNELDNELRAIGVQAFLDGQGGRDRLFGDSGNDDLDGGADADFMAGGAGDDLYYVEDAGDEVAELAGQGTDGVFAEISYTLSANVEDLFLGGETGEEPLAGTGNALGNLIEGNDGDNVLSGLDGDDGLYGFWGDDTLAGGAGHDDLDGGLGADLMIGGEGDDFYWVDDELDVTTEESAAGGHDLVLSSRTHTLGENLEDLELLDFDAEDNFVGAIDGFGNALDNRIAGNESENLLEGLAGNDTLLGRDGEDELYGFEGDDTLDGGSGEDYLEGGAGDDTYVVDDFFEEVVESEAEGVDLVLSSADFELAANVENLTLLGDFALEGDDVDGLSGVGNELDNVIAGNDAGNGLGGLQGDDKIDGRAGSDFINGGEGNDVLYGGDDAIFVSVDGEAGSDSDDDDDEDEPPLKRPHGGGETVLTGNSDSIDAGEGDDDVDGGSGDDALFGGDGNDSLYGGDDGLTAQNVVIDGGEGGFGGAGTLDGEMFFLTNDDQLEGGDGDDVLDGGSGRDFLAGGEGNDVLRGGADGPLNLENDDALDGGAGLDTMEGGTGDDRYWLDGTFVETTDIPVFDDCGHLVPGAVTRVWTTDTVLENAGEGYDRIFADAEITLPENFEELELGGAAGVLIGRGNAGANTLIGSFRDNRLEGGAGDDRLFGRSGNDVLEGGAGDDELWGEGGNDTYNLGPGSGHDTVINTFVGLDTVHVTQHLSLADLTFSTNGDDLTIGIDGSRDRMVLDNWFNSAAPVRQVLFCDGTLLDASAMAALASGLELAAADDAAAAFEDGPGAAGNVLENDFDSDPDAVLSVYRAGTYEGAYGTLVIAESGDFSYAAADRAQWLAEGESAFDTFDYCAQDLRNANDQASLEIAVLGANDAPLFAGDAAGAVTEDAVVRELRDERVSNGGLDDFFFEDWELEGDLEFVGHIESTLDDEAGYFGAIGEETLLGQEVETESGERYLVSFWLKGGGSGGVSFEAQWNGATLVSLADVTLEDYTEFSFEVQGADEASALGFALRNDPGFWYLDEISVREIDDEVGDEQSTFGSLAFTDVDLSDSHSVVSFEPQGEDYLGFFDAFVDADSSFSELGVVEWDFEVENDELQFLAEGQVLVQRYDIVLEDDFGATATATVEVTLHGANDEPEAEDDEAFVTEDLAPLAAGNVLENDEDPDDGAVLAVTTTGAFVGEFGILTLAADGSYTYALDAAASQLMAEGELFIDFFDYEISDGFSAEEPITGELAVRIIGVNDAPVVLADAGAVQEDVIVQASGNVLGNDADPDEQDELAVIDAPATYTGAYGTLMLEEDGSYSYLLDNASALVQSLAAGETAIDSFSYGANDSFEVVPGVLEIAVTGSNDAPLALDDAAALIEGLVPGAAGNLLANDSDIDNGAALAVATPGSFTGAHGILTVTASGDYSYVLAEGSEVQALREGETVFDVFAYAASDGITLAVGELLVSIAGTNDAPVLANPIADQDAEAGSAFSFTFAVDAFTDIDQGDALSYTATLADGSALPGWLSFDAATRAFTGTPPADAGCGCCGMEAETLEIRVQATDLAGASAFDDFALTVEGGEGGGGQVIVGTDGDDVLAGTACDDMIDGRAGFDRMLGGAGNDIYFVDQTCEPKHAQHGNEGVGNGEDPPPPGHEHDHNDGPGTSPGHPGSKKGKGGHEHHDHDHDHGHHHGDHHGHEECRVDEVVEAAGEGYDVVFAAAGYALADNVEEVRLLGDADLDASGNSLDNLLAGNAGDNRLSGGLGADVYVYERGGGDDVIADAGGQDVLRFGEGITPDMVRARRRHDDLVLELAGSKDSVTLEDWFERSSRRVEAIAFADGSAWDEAAIRARTEGRADDWCDPWHGKRREDHEHRRGHEGDDGRDDRDDRDDGPRNYKNGHHRHDAHRRHFDFEELHKHASGWSRVQAFASRLAGEDLDDLKHGAPGAGGKAWPLLTAALGGGAGWGYDGSTGAARGPENLKTLEGLAEGFRRL